MFKKIVLCIFFAGLFWAVGCNRITTENYDQLKVGMDYNDVTSLLGETKECEAALGLKKCKWGEKNKFIMVSFAGDKVVVFSGHGL